MWFRALQQRLHRTTPERTRHAVRESLTSCGLRTHVHVVGPAHVVESARHARAPVHVTRTVAPTSLPSSERRIIGTSSNCSWTTKCRNIASCYGLESLRGQVRMHSVWVTRTSTAVKSTARLDIKTCVCGVVVVEHFSVELRTRRVNDFPSMAFSRWVVVVRCDSSYDVHNC